MKPVNDKILVRSDLSQKDFIRLNGVELKSPTYFDTNYRQRSPVLCVVAEDSGDLYEGDILLCHHNTFYQPSPYYIKEDLFSIPCKGTLIFCKITLSGDLWPLFGNMLCNPAAIESLLYLPEKYRKPYPNRAVITEPGLCNYSKNDLVFCRPYAPYEIVYQFAGAEKRQFKIHESMVAGVAVV